MSYSGLIELYKIESSNVALSMPTKEVEEFLPLKDGWKENYEYNK